MIKGLFALKSVVAKSWQPEFGHVDLNWQVFGLFPKLWQDTVHVANVGLQTNIP